MTGNGPPDAPGETDPTEDPAPRLGPDAISDPRTMRALAHPVRLALLEALMRDGPLTATRAAELLDESPGNMSWHLQTLAKYGFIEEAGGGRGRSRPWRAVSSGQTFDTSQPDPEHAAAGEALEASFLDRGYHRLREWWSQRRTYSAEWRQSAFANDSITYLTAEEMRRLGDDIFVLFTQYRSRSEDRSARPADALPVHLVAFGHPIPPTPSGN
jgi:DNA-binding transcriptional ArsR family regulator